MKPFLTVAALSLLLLVAGCGGGGGAPAPTGGSSGPVEEVPPGEVEGGRTVVDIQDLEFVPGEVNVPAGASITFTNSDDVSHTVTKRDGPGPDFDSGPIQPGGTFSQVFPEPGVVEVFDKNRPETELTITVEEVDASEEDQSAPPEDEQGGGSEDQGGGSQSGGGGGQSGGGSGGQ